MNNLYSTGTLQTFIWISITINIFNNIVMNSITELTVSKTKDDLAFLFCVAPGKNLGLPIWIFGRIKPYSALQTLVTRRFAVWMHSIHRVPKRGKIDYVVVDKYFTYLSVKIRSRQAHPDNSDTQVQIP